MPRLFWDHAGHGEPLVLLHGIGSTHADFTALRPALDDRYAVFAPDLPGQGASPAVTGVPSVAALADAIEADLDDLGLHRVHLVGNSLGGRIALELAARGRALSVVAIAPSGLGLPPERLYEGALLGGTRMVLRSSRRLIEPASRSRWGRTVLLTGLRSMPWRASRPEALALRDGIAGAGDFWRLLWHAVLSDVPTDLRIPDIPVVLAQGTADVLAGGQTPRFRVLIPTARFTPLFGAGHAPQSDRPAAILALVDGAVAAARAAGTRSAPEPLGAVRGAPRGD
ncbi:alpha/beta fold hydrolase [Nakamurella deserti]|uniref:alpha/beta fold hydrolase n=1 Tax=Nakamurella deserti TaxID=2164074 RepID=UPI000DBE7F77|nr:alpha/beta fold hydrolase [Nakamurella deserti]